LLSFAVCNIFVAWYFVCSAWSCAATISLSVSLLLLLLLLHLNSRDDLYSCTAPGTVPL
jgi:hypothetical protein